MKWIPNALTILRCVFALCVLLGFVKAQMVGAEIQRIPDYETYGPLQQLWYQFALLAFVGGAITDFLDGYLARAMNAQSRFGVWLDPIADKLLIGAALIGLCITLQTYLIYFPAAAIIARDIFMTWFRTTPRGKSAVSPSNLAKWKTTFEFLAIAGFMAPLALVTPAHEALEVSAFNPVSMAVIIGLVGLLWIAAGLSLLTGWLYLKSAKQP